MTTEPVLFYGHKGGVYAAFSNWYPAEFVYDGLTFANSEQAMMYYKSEDPAYRKRVLETPDPAAVKKLGRTCTLRPDWDAIKSPKVRDILKAKFGQNPRLGDLLILTGNRDIHENCADEWWGGGPNYPKGRDLLGKALMEVRAWLRANEEAACSTS